MQRAKFDFSTHILCFGVDPKTAQEIEARLKESLSDDPQRWSVEGADVQTLAQAIAYIEANPGLEVLVIPRQAFRGARTYPDMLADMEQLAVALAAHPHKPWVALNTDYCEDVEPIFEKTGVDVCTGYLSNIVRQRWRSQIVSIAA